MTKSFTPRRLRLLIALGVLLSVAGLQCIESPLDPIFPYSDVQLSIPLLDITQFATDFFKDTTTTRVGTDGSISFEQLSEAEPIGIDTITFSPAGSVNQVEVGLIEVPGISDVGASFSPTDAGIPPGTYPAGIPPGSTTLDPIAIDQSSDFDYVNIQTGSLNLSITNNLPIPIDFPNGIILKNNSSSPLDTGTVASFIFTDTLQQGQTRNLSSDLAGMLLRGVLQTGSITIRTPGRAGSVTVQSTDGISFTFGSTPLLAQGASAIIPGYPVASVSDSIIVIDDSVSVNEARFSSGLYLAKIVNNLGINVGVFLKFSNFVSAAGDTFTIDRVLAARESLSVPVRMDTLRLVNGTPDPLGTRMRFSVGIYTINSGGAKQTVSQSDYVRAEFLPQEEFVVQSITGRIKPTVIPVAAGAPGPDIGKVRDNFEGTFSFDSVQIAVNLRMTGGFPTAYSLRLVALNSVSGVTRSLILPPPTGQTDTIFYPSGNTTTTINLGNSQGLNTFLAGFFPDFPDSFIVQGAVILNPNFQVETIPDTAKFYSSVNVYFPLKFGLTGGRLAVTEPVGEGGQLPDFFQDVKRMGLNFELTNRFPMQFAFRAFMLGRADSVSPYDTLLRIPSEGPHLILGSEIDGSGSGTNPRISAFSIQLTNPEMELFNKADSMHFRLDINTTDNVPVRIRTVDYIRIRLSGNVIYTVNKP